MSTIVLSPTVKNRLCAHLLVNNHNSGTKRTPTLSYFLPMSHDDVTSNVSLDKVLMGFFTLVIKGGVSSSSKRALKFFLSYFQSQTDFSVILVQRAEKQNLTERKRSPLKVLEHAAKLKTGAQQFRLIIEVL